MNRQFPFWFCLRIVLAIAVCVFIVNWLQSQKLPPMPSLEESVWGLTLAGLLIIPGLLIRALKWHMFANTIWKGLSFKLSLKSYVGAIPVSLLTPGRVGEAARVLYLPQIENKWIQGAKLVFFDKITDLASVLWWAIASAFIIFDEGTAFVVFVLALFVSAFPFWIGRVKSLQKIILFFLSKFMAQVKEMPSSQFGGLKIIMITVLAVIYFGVEWLQTYILIHMFGIDVDFIQVASVMTVVTLINMFQITFAGLGVREGLAALLLERFCGVPAVVGASCAFLIFIIDQALPAIVALFLKFEKETDNG